MIDLASEPGSWLRAMPYLVNCKVGDHAPRDLADTPTKAALALQAAPAPACLDEAVAGVGCDAPFHEVRNG